MQAAELVSITLLVPQEDAGDFYTLAASRLLKHKNESGPSHGSVNGSSPAGGSNGEGPHNGWTDALIERQFLESPDSMKRFQKALAEKPNVHFSIEQLARVLGVKKGTQVVGALGAYGRRTRNRYKKENSWPFRAELNPSDGLFYYWMDERTANIIQQL